jgi:hypothetical protein
MAIGRFALPEHWEDWAGLVLGLWLCASPWVLGFAEADRVATENAFLVGALLIAAEMVILSAFHAWEEAANLVLGAWLVISTWVLGVAATAAMANFVIVGLLVLALALYELWEVRHHAASAG